MYQNKKNKFKSNSKEKIGYIVSYEVDENIIKNDWVDQKDYFHHIVKIKDKEGNETQHLLRQLDTERKYEEGTHVSFKYYPVKEANDKAKSMAKELNQEVQELTMIEARTFVKKATPEELLAFQNGQVEQEKQKVKESLNEKRRNRPFRR